MKEATQCVLWNKPELTDGPMKERFELLDTFMYESHQWRYLLKCRECGQLYFFEFYEEIDWEDGKDPQCSIYIPLETGNESLKHASRFELLQLFPRLQNDFPKRRADANPALHRKTVSCVAIAPPAATITKADSGLTQGY
jgi:hypothetical protein